jgi:hypothetical protein
MMRGEISARRWTILTHEDHALKPIWFAILYDVVDSQNYPIPRHQPTSGLLEQEVGVSPERKRTTDSKGSKRSVNGLPRTHPSKTMKLRNGVSVTQRYPACTYGITKSAICCRQGQRISGYWWGKQYTLIHTILEPTAAPRGTFKSRLTEPIMTMAWSTRTEIAPS